MYTIGQQEKPLRVIRKRGSCPEECHHIELILWGKMETSWKSYIVAKMTAMLPKILNLRLELSIMKKSKEIYYCSQCGSEFHVREALLYRKLFDKAKTCGYDVWKLKTIFAWRDRKSEEQLMDKITADDQIYECRIDRIVGAGILLGKNEDQLYDDMIKKFRKQ